MNKQKLCKTKYVLCFLHFVWVLYMFIFNACYIHKVDRRCSVIFIPEKQVKIACAELLRWITPEPELTFTSDLNCCSPQSCYIAIGKSQLSIFSIPWYTVKCHNAQMDAFKLKALSYEN